jgi:ribonuclease Z
MSLRLLPLGKPGRDNALWVAVDSGQRISRLLFDCGQCLAGLPRADLAHLDHVFFSHLHMDHVCGFDGFFRLTYNRPDKPVTLWGPPGTIAILHHRFRGVVWNLHEGEPGEWIVREIHPDRIESARFYTTEAFAVRHEDPPAARAGAGILADPDFTVQAEALDHGIPSMGYVVRETDRWNVRLEALAADGLAPGPWLQKVKDLRQPDNERVEVSGRVRTLGEWRGRLLQRSSGDSAAYLTDFRLDDQARARLAALLDGCRTLVCESQYRQAEESLAREMGHLTATQAADLARAAQAERLILFHVSERYTAAERAELLAEARAVFPGARWPEHWT